MHWHEQYSEAAAYDSVYQNCTITFQPIYDVSGDVQVYLPLVVQDEHTSYKFKENVRQKTKVIAVVHSWNNGAVLHL
jgi:hypothetical protein